jgi:hypothetical protein
LPGGATLSVSNINELFNGIPELVQRMQNEIADGIIELPVPIGLEFEISEGSATITGYVGTATTLNIPSQIQGLPVTAIGRSAFSYCINLENVTIPPSVTAIGDSAFFHCYNLTNIIIPSLE